uniref:Glycosyl transferase family 1 domain-containing protein n=1 Tax=Tetraselmis sp. GSL018 TaxID=582737 RepID=A0A061S389_9CHLO
MAYQQSSSRTIFAALVGIVCVSVICYNLGSLQSKMESMLMDEPGGRRQKILRGLTTKMKNIVGSSTDKDMEKVIQAVKQKLGHEFEDTLSKEVDEIESQLGSGALDESPKSPPRAPPSKEEVASILSDSLVGAEDLDDAVEKRAKELEAEEKLDPRKRHGYYIVGWVKQPPWPFQKIHDRNGRDTGVVGLCAPFIKYYYNSMWEKALFWRLKARGHVMLGISSYEWFPGNATNPITDRTPQLNPEDKKMYASVDAFAHCFRKPWEHIAPGIPRALISQSDFVNADSSDLQPKGLAKQYTFGHSNLAGVWNDFNRNWTVTVKCVKLAVKNGMNVLLVGKKKDADKNPKRIAEIKPLIDKGSVTITDMLPHRELGDVMEKSRFWFVPNQSDASPRVVAEALCRGTPVIMNRHIAGGWKYINDQTGVFFDGPDDFLPAIERLEKLRAAGKLRPREWFMENYGNHRSSLRLQALLELAVGKDRLEKARALAHKW